MEQLYCKKIYILWNYNVSNERYTNILNSIAIMVEIIICAEMKTDDNLWVDKAI